MRVKLIILILITTVTAGFSQFRGEATLPTVENDGFYRILVSPDLCTHLNSNLTNVRIFSQQNKEVPYLLQAEIPAYYTASFKSYEIVEKSQQKKCCTKLILKNSDETPINNISLLIKNADVTKLATLLGSDDKQNWFALKEGFMLSPIDNKNQTSEIKIVDFPLSNYTYYLLQIDDSTSAPLNILSAGYYEVNQEIGKYTEVSTFTITKSDSVSQKRTFVSIKFDTVHVFDKLTIAMTGAPYFLRAASLAAKRERIDKKGNKTTYFEWLTNFTISSKQPSVLELSGVHLSELLVTIDNKDNPPLEVASIKAHQLNRYLTAWLKKDETYKLRLGDINLGAPVYDIGYFRDSIPDQAKILSLGAISLFSKTQEPPKTFFTSRAFIWAAIVIVIGVLGTMTLRMVSETSKKDNSL